MIEQDIVLRTAPEDYESLRNRTLNSISICQLIHAHIGLSDEVGEFGKCLKKTLIYDQNFDVENAKEELGDILWYVSLATKTLNTTIEELISDNAEKLKIRYPEKFTEELAKEKLDKVRIPKYDDGSGNLYVNEDESPGAKV